MKYNSIIIGFGKGGKTLVADLAKSGEKVALIEKSAKMYGGTCINVGCLPSKSLVKNAELAVLKDGDFNIKADFYKKAVEEKNNMTAMLRKKNFDKLDSLENIDIINGEAAFIDQHTVCVSTDDNEERLEGEKIFINTGAYPFIPPIDGIEGNPNVFTSESLMDLEDLPRRLTIVGGGYIGLEFASMYASFGSEVTVIDSSEEFLKREDTDIAETIREILENKGIKIISGARAKNVEADTLYYEKEDDRFSIEQTKILLATGRRPNIETLNLEKANVEVTDRGLIKVDKHYKTTADNIWAMGDVASSLQFTYISLDVYRIVRFAVLEKGEYNLEKRKNVPYSVFTTPSFSRVGINEKEAKEQGIEYKLFKIQAAAIPKARVLDSPEGILKALVDPSTGKILGAMLLCEESYEMINTVKLAMDLEAEYTVLRDNIYTHPTMTEALNDLFKN